MQLARTQSIGLWAFVFGAQWLLGCSPSSRHSGGSGSGGESITATGGESSGNEARGGTSSEGGQTSASGGAGAATTGGAASEGGDATMGDTPIEGGASNGGASNGGTTNSGASNGGGTAGAAVSYVGNWTGQIGTDSKYGLSFLVDETGALKDITLTDSTTACSGTGVVEAAKSGAIQLSGDGTFSLTLVGCGKVTCYTDYVEGTLKGDGTAEGIVRKYGACSLAGCTSVITSGATTPWRAATDCSLRPAQGASAQRFCDASGAPRSDPPAVMPTTTTVDGLTCSVTPPGTGGAGGSSATGSGGSGGSGGASGSASTGGRPANLGNQCADVGCPYAPEDCACPSSIPDCDVNKKFYWGPSDACEGGQCVGEHPAIKRCSAPCSSDADCDNPTISMRCVQTCVFSNIVRTCWPSSSTIWETCQ